MHVVSAVISSLAALHFVTALPPSQVSPKKSPPPVPVVIWHGLGDRHDAPGLLELKSDLENRPTLKGVFVHIVQVEQDGTADQRATFFGSAAAQVQHVCEQIADLPEIMDSRLNPSRRFDAVGFSQGGQLLRAVVEVCGPLGDQGDVTVRNLITLGSQHMGISSLPPCPANSSPFSPCKLMHLSLVRSGLYSTWAQRNLIPAQYVRDDARIDDYLRVNEWLKDINNERMGDRQVGPPSPLTVGAPAAAAVDNDDNDAEPRNATYKANFQRLDNLVLLRFSRDLTVVPPHSSHFTLPATACPAGPGPTPPLPGCYAPPVPLRRLPLYADGDYVGLRALDERGAVRWGVCEGEHMEIDEACWEAVVSWLGAGGGGGKGEGKGRSPAWTAVEVPRPGDEHGEERASAGGLTWQAGNL